MLVKPNEQIPLARLLRFLELGEHLAHDCAQTQAELAPDPRMRAFLLNQARQERYHAIVFQAAATWLSPRRMGINPFLQPLQQYRSMIETALRNGDLAETLLAEQVILEGYGEAILHRIEAGLVKRKAPFRRLRQMLLHQEDAHHSFGIRTLERMITREQTSGETLRQRAQEYMVLMNSILNTASDLFESIDESPGDYISDAETYFPTWLTKETLS